jgi:phosphomannomutase
MNRAVVRATTAGLAGWLRAHRPEATDVGVVIGCDARHRSRAFAEEAAAVLAGAGIPAHLLPYRLPTPVLAFAVRHLGAAAGVMVTASHNPPADNGYKLYLGDGAQIVPPVDGEIEAAIARVGPLSGVLLAPPDDVRIHRVGQSVVSAYLDAVTARASAPAGADQLRVVYTPLHGVARDVLLAAVERAGYPAPRVVTEQADPDPDFPTVAFPNPEEPGALDLALDQARATHADLVIANDPDGDRLAVAVPDPAADGGWRILRGDELGVLLADHVLRATADEPEPQQRVMVTTVVSSTMLARMAEAAGVHFVETLTGFKWIVRGPEQVRGGRFVFGYEEALGYCIGDVVRDKDGIGAALTVLALATGLRAQRQTLLDRLDELSIRHGVHLTDQLSIGFAAGDGAAAVMRRLRAAPWTELGGEPVLTSVDLAAGSGSLPPSDVLVFHLDNGRVVIRPSGTEPKLKCYLQVVAPVEGTLPETRAVARSRLARLRAAVGHRVV